MENGYRALEPGSGAYPTAVAEAYSIGRRSKQPPTLYVLGDPEPLYEQGVGLSGSRNAGEAGLEMAAEVGRVAGEVGKALVSGYARGVDTMGHIEAIRSGGHTIAVLAEGIDHFKLRDEYFGCVGEGPDSMTIVSQFDPSAPWSVRNAMARNRLVCALSLALVAIEPGEKGGTLDAAQEMPKQGKRLLVFVDSAVRPGAAVSKLLTKGTRISSKRDLRNEIERLADVPPIRPLAGQGSLFG